MGKKAIFYQLASALCSVFSNRALFLDCLIEFAVYVYNSSKYLVPTLKFLTRKFNSSIMFFFHVKSNSKTKSNQIFKSVMIFCTDLFKSIRYRYIEGKLFPYFVSVQKNIYSKASVSAVLIE